MTDQSDSATVTRTAIVTGAARGIGAAIARRLSSDGFAVAVLDLDEMACKEVVAEIEASGGMALAVGADVADEQSVETAVARVAAELGAPTVLVNNAGITRDNLLLRMKDDEWDAIMATNLKPVFRLAKAVLRGMMKARHGRIIQIGSVVGSSGNPGQANYAASKAGVIGMVQALAAQVAERGITVNAVAPGFIETEMTARIPLATRELGRRINSLGQGGQPVDVAETIAWLAQGASAGVTGQVVRVCGQSLLGA